MRLRRICLVLVSGVALAAAIVAAPLAAIEGTRQAAGNDIHADDFESGNTLAWDDRVPPLPAPTVYRYSDLDLRDPHVFIDVPVFGCSDFTDDPLPGGLGPSFNELLETAITTDGDLDGLLDLSLLLGFRPFDDMASGERLDAGLGECLAPIGSTVCDWMIPPVPRTTSYDGMTLGTCLEVHPGTTSGYSPPPAEPAAPCMVSAPALVIIDFVGIQFELVDSQTGATFADMPVTMLEDGLLLGFLPEAVADAILLPPEVPIIGGQPLSVLFPGGTGNCAPGDDRDTHQAESGWWFYLNFPADLVPFVGD